MIRVSAGTARVLGLNNIKCEVPPTTAYLLLGEKCLRGCSFCSRSRDSSSPADLLSRVTWPLFPAKIVIESIDQAYLRGDLGRVCLQVVHHREARAQARRALKMITCSSGIPVSVCCTAGSIQHIQEWFESGAQRFGLALDAAAGKIFYKVKGGGWEKQLALIYEAAHRWAGKVSTHIIVGLGETDREVTALLQDMAQRKVRVGLFAFTPVKGTRMQLHKPPPLLRYRRIQAVYHLIDRYGADIDSFSFDREGYLLSPGLTGEKLEEILADGEAFRTGGCPMCNRPFYNERPGGEIYNYPRRLSPAEAADALHLLTDAGAGLPQ